MPKLPNSLRGPGGERRPSGKGERYHGVGLLMLLLTFFAAYVFSLILSWGYFSSQATGPDPWGWSAVGVLVCCVWGLVVFPILAALLMVLSRLIPGLKPSLTAASITLVVAAMATPHTTQGFLWLMMTLKVR